MDLPVHVAAGALAGNVLLYIHAKFRPRLDWDAEMVKLGAAGLLYGVILHLLLDALPYYDWLFYIHIFKPLPYYWMFPQVLTTLPVLAAIFQLNRDARLVTSLSILGGVYPDIEKLAYIDWHLPKSLVLFPFHSCRLSGSAWESSHKSFLILWEIGIFALIMLGLYWCAGQRMQMLARRRAFSVEIMANEERFNETTSAF